MSNMSSMQGAQHIVAEAWQNRQAVKLDVSGGWHVCSRHTCNIIHLREHVCVAGQHIIAGAHCAEHPGSDVIFVDNLYGCLATGSLHVCDRTTCATENGRCCVSGLACMAASHVSLAVPPTNKRSRRRQNGVHTNKQSACVLLYDLLFSRRRINSEIRRATSALELARRKAQRKIKLVHKEGLMLQYQELVDIFNCARQRMRYTQFINICVPSTRESICVYYAEIVTSVWDSLAKYLPVRSTFESTCAAVLYAMRKGVACDGMYAIPADSFLLCALPDAHAIKEVHISRRVMTQARNTVYNVLQNIIRSNATTVEQFAFKFKLEQRPEVLQTHYSNT